MKKLFVLSIVCVFILTGLGCTTISLSSTSVDQRLNQIARDYKITKSIKLRIIGEDLSLVDTVKEVADNYGFNVVQVDFIGPVDYELMAERQVLSQKNSGLGYGGYGWYYGHGYGGRSLRSKCEVKVKLTGFDDVNGIERYYTGAEKHQTQSHRSSFGSHYSSVQVDPLYIPTKKAAMTAVADFIDQTGIPYRRPRKKKK